MKTKINKAGILICTLAISSCSMMKMDSESDNYYSPYSFGQKKQTATAPLYPDGYDNTVNISENVDNTYQGTSMPAAKTVTVPESYHVSTDSAPVSFKDREKSWIGRQNPQNYTIQIDNSGNASDVAKTLQRAPKDARSAEVKYERDGEKRYRGVYGTYSSYEAAQKALNNLPSDLKQNAQIKTWGSVQSPSGE